MSRIDRNLNTRALFHMRMLAVSERTPLAARWIGVAVVDAARLASFAVAVFAGFSLSAPTARAQTVVPADPRVTATPVSVSPDSALAAALARIEGEPIALAEVLRLAAERSTDVRAAEAAVAEASGALRSARGAFDPELFAEFNAGRDERPTASYFAGADILDTRTRAGSFGARISLPLGTELEASLSALRTETNSAFAALDPQYEGLATLTIRQPLLRGLQPEALSEVRAAQSGEEAALALMNDARRAVRATAYSLYWEIHAAERDCAVQSLILDQGRALLGEARQRAGAGLVGPGDVANARVFVAEQEQAVLEAEERLDSVSDALAALIGHRPSGSPRFHPTDSPPQEFELPDVEGLVALARETNSGLQAGLARMEALRARVKGARWETLPAVDVVGLIGTNALSGTGRDVVFGADTLRTAMNGGLEEIGSQLGSGDYPTWSAGVRFSLPIGLRQAGGELERRRAELRRAEQEQEAAQRTLEQAVRAGHRELRHGVQRLAAAREGVAASQEQVRIGAIEFRNGRSTAFELVRLGADLAAAQRRLSQALVRAAVAAARLDFLTSGAYSTAEPYKGGIKHEDG